MSSIPRRWSASQIEAALRQIRGVTSIRVVPDAQGVIQEVHATVEGDRSPKQAVRDIEAVLQAKFSLSIDHKKISIAQMDDAMDLVGGRLRWLDVAVNIEGNRADASVRLQRDGETFIGTASGQRSAPNQLRLVGEATLRAIESAYGLDERFAIEEINGNVVVASLSAVVVLVNMIRDAGEDHLIGSALIKGDQLKSVVFATLDAVNRRVMALANEIGSAPLST